MIFHLDDNGALLQNPGMGWVIHHNAISEQKDPNEPDHYENLGNVALLSYWAALEPEEGVFRWERLDASIAAWTARGKKPPVPHFDRPHAVCRAGRRGPGLAL